MPPKRGQAASRRRQVEFDAGEDNDDFAVAGAASGDGRGNGKGRGDWNLLSPSLNDSSDTTVPKGARRLTNNDEDNDANDNDEKDYEEANHGSSKGGKQQQRKEDADGVPPSKSAAKKQTGKLATSGRTGGAVLGEDAVFEEGNSGLVSKKQKEKLRKQRLKDQSKAVGKGVESGPSDAAKKSKRADEDGDDALLDKMLQEIPVSSNETEPPPIDSPTVAVKKATAKSKKTKAKATTTAPADVTVITTNNDGGKEGDASNQSTIAADTTSPDEKVVKTIASRKKKFAGPSIADIQRVLNAKRAAEEEIRRQAEEEKRLEEEERLRELEEERQKEELRVLKREREKAKREQLRKEGKLLSKSQKEAQARAKLKLEQLLASGVVIEGMMSGGVTANDDTNDHDLQSTSKNQKSLRQSKFQESHRKKRPPTTANSVIADPKTLTLVPETAIPEIAAIIPGPEVDSSSQAEQEPIESKSDVIKESWEDYSDSEDTAPPTLKKKPEQLPVSLTSAKIPTSRPLGKTTGTGISDQPKKKVAATSKKPDKVDKEDLRSPICCILGHVDTGKTKLLDKIRQTNVQEGEAGGITQQIGATYFPADAIRTKTAVMDDKDFEIKVPGLLIIDTPGHESFTNLRSRGSSLCNIAILVVDIMHGLEQQTLESLDLLRQRKTPFIIALNKIDRIYGWEMVTNDSFANAIKRQSSSVVSEFEERLQKISLKFCELGMNTALYTRNTNFGKYVSILPTSAITGEGIPDMLYMLISLTQTRMTGKLMFVGELEATVLEVKVIEGLGTTIDVILSNGILNEGDRIVVCGLDGAIVTNIRALLTPQPMRELRIKSQYVHHRSIKAAMGVKISAQGLDGAVPGSRLLVVGPGRDEDDLREDVMADLQDLMSSVDKSGHGVWVQASTLGSLEALLTFLKESKIPVSGINIGPVHRRDVVKASVILQHTKEYAVMLCFDVKIEREAQEFADDMGVKIFSAEIIYHLFDMFKKYYSELVELKRKEAAPVAVFPCILKIVPGAIFNKRDPIVLGVDVVEGSLRVGTPLCVTELQPTGEHLVIPLGKVTSMEMNHKSVEVIKKGQSGGGVAIKIECPSYETPKMFGRHFIATSEIFSLVTRQSIDMLKENFKDDMTREDWALMIKLKRIFSII